MAVQTITTLKANMPVGTTGGTSVQDIHDLIDTFAARTGVSVAEFGAIGDGVSDDTAAVVAAFSTGVRQVRFEPGKIYLIGEVQVPSDVTIVGYGATVKRKAGSDTFPVTLSIVEKINVRIYGLTIDGNRTNQSGTLVDQDGGGHGIRILASQNIVIEDVTVKSCYTDGIYIANDTPDPGDNDGDFTKNVWLTRCVCDGNRRQGLSVIQAEGLWVTDCEFRNTSGAAPQGGVDLEPNPGTNQYLKDIFFDNCRFLNNVGYGFIIHLQDRPGENIVVNNCTSFGNPRSFNVAWVANAQLKGFHIRGGFGDAPIYINGSTFDGVVMTGISIEGVTLTGNGLIRFQNVGTTTEDIHRFRIVNNSIVSTATTHLILLNGVSGGLIANNHIEGTTAPRGIEAANQKNLMIMNNRIKGVTQIGINISSTQDCTVIGNVISNCGQSGIICYGSRKISIFGNRTYSNTEYGIRFYNGMTNTSSAGNVAYNNTLGNIWFEGSGVFTGTGNDIRDAGSMKVGSTSATTSAAGIITIAHGLAFAPRSVTLSVRGSSDYTARVSASDATNLTVLVKDTAGANLVSTAVVVDWSAYL